MSASEDTPDDAAPQPDRWIFVEGPRQGGVDAPCDALPTGSPYSGNMLALSQPGAGKTALLCTLLNQVTTKVFLPNPDARDDAYCAALRLTDAEFRRLRTPRSA